MPRSAAENCGPGKDQRILELEAALAAALFWIENTARSRAGTSTVFYRQQQAVLRKVVAALQPMHRQRSR